MSESYRAKLDQFCELVNRTANARKTLWIVVVADQEAAGADLGPLGFDVGFDGFVAVLAVDEDEVEFSVFEAAGGFY